MQGLSTLPRGREDAVILSDLSADDKIGLVLVLGNGGQDVPANDADVPFSVLVDGATAGNRGGVVELGNSPGEQPLRASGAGNAGDWLCMEVVANGAGKTRVKPGAGGGNVYVYGRAKENFVDGQLFRATVFAPRYEAVPA